MELDYYALGERIRIKRKEKAFTQNRLADIVEVETSNISHIERGVSKVGLNTLVKIANALECSIDELLCDSVLIERRTFENELTKIVQDCSPLELRLITDLASSMKESMRKRNFDNN